MKRLCVALSIILLLAGLATLHVARLDRLTGELIGQLEAVDTSLDREDWSGAGETAQAIMTQWEEQAFYLHTTLRHTEIDAIRSSLREILAYLDSRDDAAECQAVTAKLINQLELLVEAELPSIKNLL